jgi:hypothetical protein
VTEGAIGGPSINGGLGTLPTRPTAGIGRIGSWASRSRSRRSSGADTQPKGRYPSLWASMERPGCGSAGLARPKAPPPGRPRRLGHGVEDRALLVDGPVRGARGATDGPPLGHQARQHMEAKPQIDRVAPDVHLDPPPRGCASLGQSCQGPLPAGIGFQLLASGLSGPGLRREVATRPWGRPSRCADATRRALTCQGCPEWLRLSIGWGATRDWGAGRLAIGGLHANETDTQRGSVEERNLVLRLARIARRALVLLEDSDLKEAIDNLV